MDAAAVGGAAGATAVGGARAAPEPLRRAPPGQSGELIRLLTSIIDKDFGKGLALFNPEKFITGLDFKSRFLVKKLNKCLSEESFLLIVV